MRGRAGNHAGHEHLRYRNSRQRRRRPAANSGGRCRADIYKTPLVMTNAIEGPAYGVALLAGVRHRCLEIGRRSVQISDQQRVKNTPRSRNNPGRMTNALSEFDKLYPTLKPRFNEMAGVDMKLLLDTGHRFPTSTTRFASLICSRKTDCELLGITTVTGDTGRSRQARQRLVHDREKKRSRSFQEFSKPLLVPNEAASGSASGRAAAFGRTEVSLKSFSGD